MILRSGHTVRTAGVVLQYRGRFVFQAGYDRARTSLGVVRIGGHIEHGEAPADCAIREVAEEACALARIAGVAGTVTYEVDRTPFALMPFEWVDGSLRPLLVSTLGSAGEASLTYLADTCDEPRPLQSRPSRVHLYRYSRIPNRGMADA